MSIPWVNSILGLVSLTHVTLSYLRQGFSCLITILTLVTHFT